MIILIALALFFCIILPALFLGAVIGAFCGGYAAADRHLRDERSEQAPYLRRVVR
jgi:hypothetical protein